MLANSIKLRSCTKFCLLLCLGVFVLSLRTLWAETLAEIALLNAANAYFGQDIRPSEEKLFRQIANGLPAQFTTGSKRDRTIRADRLAWLFTQDGARYVGSHGVDITGAFVEGEVNLREVNVSFPFTSTGCVFDEQINLRQATLKRLDLKGGASQTSMRRARESIFFSLVLYIVSPYRS
jgi:hypothetical protein